MDRKNYGEIKSPLKAIKTFCVEECNCGNYNYAKTCIDIKCPLYSFRLGKNPFRKKREYTNKQLEELRKRLGVAKTNKESN